MRPEVDPSVVWRGLDREHLLAPVAAPVVMRRVCKCGHSTSDHLPDCSNGWSPEDAEAPCDCVAFDLDYEESLA